jgi:hypothetical protein
MDGELAALPAERGPVAAAVGLTVKGGECRRIGERAVADTVLLGGLMLSRGWQRPARAGAGLAGASGQPGDGVTVRVREDGWEGARQPLVTLALEVRTVNAAGSPGRAALLAAMPRANDELIGILGELGGISRGIDGDLAAKRP